MSGFKGGNGNMQNLMRQAQKMQEEMEKTAELLDDWEIVGTSAGEAVVVYMNAKKIINGIELDESIVDPTDVELSLIHIYKRGRAFALPRFNFFGNSKTIFR